MISTGVSRLGRSALRASLALMVAALPARAAAQERLALSDAIAEALRLRAVLTAQSQRIVAAQGLRKQAAARANAEFEFSNENLRQSQNYSRDVDVFAVVTQPIDLAGRRGAHTAVADEQLAGVTADVELQRIALIRDVSTAYWDAREAQEARDVLNASLQTFQEIVDYHAAQFRQGVIPEQDLLRIQLEQQRLKVDAGLAAVSASQSAATLSKVMGRADAADWILTEPLDANTPLPVLSDESVLGARAEVRVAEAAVAEAKAQAHLEDVMARPELAGLFGYKRTQVPELSSGANTAIAGFRLTVPWADRNAGNRLAAAAELRSQQALLDAARTEVLADYHAARHDYEARQMQVNDIVIPLRRDAATLAQLAQAAYAQGGIDLLRLLDARKAQLDADLAWVHAMGGWQQSAAAVKFAGGQIQ